MSAFTYSTYCVIPPGEYLALTGEKLNGVDMLAVGLATHFSMSAVCSLSHIFLIPFEIVHATCYVVLPHLLFSLHFILEA